MTTATAPTPATTSTGCDLDHIYCPCDPDTALCGTDITGATFVDDVDTACVVCLDLEETDAPCALCGSRA
ncbi:hypothetical protein [Streptomyces sp. NPDC020983]|uniref:hypothetical protein n=1 Tax=Streptomyces sp. NPDC020983 TaxID=3365106 RepID=UPI00379AEA75